MGLPSSSFTKLTNSINSPSRRMPSFSAELLTWHVVVLGISVNATCAFLFEEIIEEGVSRLVGVALAVVFGIEHSTGAKGVPCGIFHVGSGRFGHGINLTDDLAVFLEGDGEVKLAVLRSIKHSLSCIIHGFGFHASKTMHHRLV